MGSETSTFVPSPQPGQGGQVPLEAIKPGGTNPRKTFDQAELEELAGSIREHGVIQPVLLRPWPKDRDGGPVVATGGRYELVVGERRWRAATLAGIAMLPAVVRELSDQQVVEIQVVENLQRTGLHPLEEADGYRRLIAAKYDVAHIAERVGRSVAYVYDRLKLMNLVDGARELFLNGKIQAGHAIVLARLKPEDQKRAIATHGALFEDEHTLFDPTEDEAGERQGEDLPEDVRDLDDDIDLSHSKTRTVRELQAWVDEHVHFDEFGPEADPMLFPDTVAAVTRAAEDAEKVIQITHQHFVQPCAKDGTRIYGPQSWRPADPPCERQVTGVIVVGPGRGQAFSVCVDKKGCEVHWKDEIRARQKAEKASTTESAKSGRSKWEIEEEKQREEQKRREARRVRWNKALPAILKAIAAAVDKVPAPAKGLLGDLVVQSCIRGFGFRSKPLVARGSGAEDLVRHAAFLVLDSHARAWDAAESFPKLAKELGVDVKAILDQVAPEEKPTPPAAPAKKSKAPAGPLARKKRAAKPKTKRSAA